MAKDLRTFLDLIRPLGPAYYLEARQPVKPEMELSALMEKLIKEGRNPVVYCPQVTGSRLPIITNLFGSYELVGLALGLSVQSLRPGKREAIVKEYGERIQHFRDPVEIPPLQAPVRETVFKGDKADLTILPIMFHAPLNSGKYVTAGLTILKDPDSGIPNVGVYRQELKGPRRLVVAPGPGQHGYKIAQRYAELGKRMEVVTVIGHHPACFMAAAVVRPGKRDENELKLMGALLGEPLEVTKGLTVDLPIPARAEIVIEGVVDPLKMEKEGPFSEGAGYYGEGRACWVMEVTAITMRRDAIYQDLQPIQAEHLFSFVTQREHNLVTAIRAVVPGIRNVHMGPENTCGKNLIYVSVRKEQDDDGVKAGVMALKTGFSRMAIVVDDDVDVCDEGEVLWAISTRLNRVALMDTTTGQLTAVQNPVLLSSPKDAHAARPGTVVVLDATRPLGVTSMTRVTLPGELLERIKLDEYFPPPW
jgi:2,5-furandicarboxylate decarboxylase 1